MTETDIPGTGAVAGNGHGIVTWTGVTTMVVDLQRKSRRTSSRAVCRKGCHSDGMSHPVKSKFGWGVLAVTLCRWFVQ